MFLTLHEIVVDMILYRLDEEAQIKIRKCPAKSQLLVSERLKAMIQDYYKLWDENNPSTMLNYEPDMVMGLDLNPKHPDNFVGEIFGAIWERLR